MLTHEEIKRINAEHARAAELFFELNGGLSQDEARVRRDQGGPALPPLDAQGLGRLLDGAATWLNAFDSAFWYLTRAVQDGRLSSALKYDAVRRLLEIAEYESPESKPRRWQFSSSREYHAAHQAWFEEDIERGSSDMTERSRVHEAIGCLRVMGREGRIALPLLISWGLRGACLGAEFWNIILEDDEVLDAIIALAEQDEVRLRSEGAEAN